MNDILKAISSKNCDGLFLTNDANIRFVSGYTGSDSYIFLTEDNKYFLTDYRYTEQATNECDGFEIITIDRDTETLEDKVAELANDNSIKKIAFEKQHLSYQLYEKLVSASNSYKLVGHDDIVESIRYIKNNDEINNLRKASQLACDAFNQFLPMIKAGITELDACLTLEYIIRKSEADDISFPVILVSGQNSSKPHGVPSRKKLEEGDFITIDFGAMYNGYRSDMTRTLIIGEPSAKQREVYETVKEAQQVGLDSLYSGVSGIEVNRKVDAVMLNSKYAQYSSKGIGHGVGLDIHELPFINQRCSMLIEENCILTMEPGLYIPSWGGVRIEDTVLVTETGYEILTPITKELIVIKS